MSLEIEDVSFGIKGIPIGTKDTFIVIGMNNSINGVNLSIQKLIRNYLLQYKDSID